MKLLLHSGYFEKRGVRTIFGPNKEEMREDSRKLSNEQIHNLYFSPNIFGMSSKRSKDGPGMQHE
jgi:hypothetical protein